MSDCKLCGLPVPEERAEFLAEASKPVVCLPCSSERPRLVLMEYGHKTAGYPVIVPPGEEQKALRCYRRSR